MAVIRKWSGDGLSPGTLTTSSAGTGDNAFDYVNGTATIVASGPRSPRIELAEASVIGRVGWAFTSTGTLAVRWYEEWAGANATSAGIIQGLTTGQTAQSFRVERIAAGNLRLRNAANTQVGSDSSGAVPNLTLVRNELVITSAGLATFTVYTGDTATVLATVSGTVGTAHDAIRIGDTANVTNRPARRIDDIVVTDTATTVGPVAGGGSPTVSAGSDQVDVEPYSTVTLTASSSEASVVWTQLTGTSVTLSGSGLVRTFTAPGTLAGETLTFRASATNGSTVTDDVAVSVLQVNERVVRSGAQVPFRITVA